MTFVAGVRWRMKDNATPAARQSVGPEDGIGGFQQSLQCIRVFEVFPSAAANLQITSGPEDPSKASSLTRDYCRLFAATQLSLNHVHVYVWHSSCTNTQSGPC